jgi:RNA polymerase sigma-70 factor (ECF subfamily)
MSREAFLKAMVEAHGRQLARYFAAHVREPSEAHDLVQEVYLRMLKLGQPGQIQCLKAYLYRVAASVAREHWRRCRTRSSHTSLEEIGDEALPRNEDATARIEHIDELVRLLDPLPPKVRAAFIWAHRDGHTYEEIGARLRVPKNRVKKYLARALAVCRMSLAGCLA